MGGHINNELVLPRLAKEGIVIGVYKTSCSVKTLHFSSMRTEVRNGKLTMEKLTDDVLQCDQRGKNRSTSGKTEKALGKL